MPPDDGTCVQEPGVGRTVGVGVGVGSGVGVSLSVSLCVGVGVIDGVGVAVSSVVEIGKVDVCVDAELSSVPGGIVPHAGKRNAKSSSKHSSRMVFL